MKIAILSDSHDAHKHVLEAIEIFKKEKVEYILHAGDMVSPFTAKAFAQVAGAGFIAVFGNCDGEKIMLKSVIEDFGGQIYENSYSGSVAGVRIFMTHKPSAIEEAAASGQYDIVVYGHTHKKDIRKVGETLIVNPGETTDWITGESSVVILDTDDMSVKEVDLE